MPGQYDRKAARAVSSNRPKMRTRFLWKQRVKTVRTIQLMCYFHELDIILRYDFNVIMTTLDAININPRRNIWIPKIIR